MKEINIKEGFSEVIKLIPKHNIENQVAFSSFKFGYWKEICDFKTVSFEFGFLGHNMKEITEKIKNSTWNIFHKKITKAIVDEAHLKGIGIMAWFGKTDKESDAIYKNLFDLGVDSICCNKPVNVKTFRDEYYK